MFSELFNIFIQKKQIQQMIAEKPAFIKAIIAFVVVSLVIQIITGIEGLLIRAINLVLEALFTGDIVLALVQIIPQIISTFIGIPVGLVGAFIFLLLMGGIEFIAARLLGGKGTGFLQYFNNLLLLNAAVTLVSGIIIIVIMLPAFIPVIGAVISAIISAPVLLAIVIYSLYLSYKLIKHYFNLSTGRAIVVLLIPVIISLAIGIVIFILFSALIIAIVAALILGIS